MITKEQIEFIYKDEFSTKIILRTFLESSENVAALNLLSTQDVRIARLCERAGIQTTVQWKELPHR